MFERSDDICDGPDKPTEYCSVGKVRPYLKSIDDWDDMEDLVDARAYNNEIILLMCDRHHIDMPLNSIMTLRERGYEHYVLLMLSRRDCNYAARFIPDVGCIWSDFLRHNPPEEYWHDIRRLWMIRWMVILRFIQSKTNVLMIDSDNGLLHDVYKFIKHDMFKPYQLLTPYEPNVPGINCGAVYIQNADVAGPVAWMSGEVMERTLRWLDDIDSLTSHLPAWLLEEEPGHID